MRSKQKIGIHTGNHNGVHHNPSTQEVEAERAGEFLFKNDLCMPTIRWHQTAIRCHVCAES